MVKYKSRAAERPCNSVQFLNTEKQPSMTKGPFIISTWPWPLTCVGTNRTGSCIGVVTSVLPPVWIWCLGSWWSQSCSHPSVINLLQGHFNLSPTELKLWRNFQPLILESVCRFAKCFYCRDVISINMLKLQWLRGNLLQTESCTMSGGHFDIELDVTWLFSRSLSLLSVQVISLRLDGDF